MPARRSGAGGPHWAPACVTGTAARRGSRWEAEGRFQAMSRERGPTPAAEPDPATCSLPLMARPPVLGGVPSRLDPQARLHRGPGGWGPTGGHRPLAGS
eukprot:14922597-Heterocapsa_arctica.AAC.1